MKFRIIKNQKWLFWAAGMVVYPFVIYRVEDPWRRLYKHELKHCYQVQEMGIAKFYFTYILLLIRHGYKNHPYEKEACSYEVKKLTPVEQKWFETRQKVIDLNETLKERGL